MTTRFRFRLASVLGLRRAELEQAERALQQANAQLRALILERTTATERCNALDNDIGTQSASDFARHRQETTLAASAVVSLDRRVNVAAAQAALAHIAWNSAHQRVKTLERLEEHRRDEWLAEDLRHEANNLDEIATAAYVREQLSTGSV
jgi:flagellar export protein FliJ